MLELLAKNTPQNVNALYDEDKGSYLIAEVSIKGGGGGLEIVKRMIPINSARQVLLLYL